MRRYRNRLAPPFCADRRGPFGDALLLFSLGSFTNGNSDRYFWDPIGKKLHGPFSANVPAVAMVAGRKYISIGEAIVETTGYTESIAGNWTPSGGASLTADATTAPDPAKLADKLTFTAAAGDRIKRNLASASDNTPQTFCVIAFTLSGTKSFRLGFLLKDGSISYSGDLTADTTFQRFSFTADILAGGSTPEARIINDSGGNAGDLYIFACAVYKDTTFPHAYRTNETGAAQTNLKDQLVFPSASVPAAILTGRHAFKFIPMHANNENALHGLDPLIHGFDANHRSRWDIANDKFVAVDDGADKVLSNALTFARDSVLTVAWDNAAGKVSVSGASAGDGTVTGAAWTWPAGNMSYGMAPNTTQQANALLSEPYTPPPL